MPGICPTGAGEAGAACTTYLRTVRTIQISTENYTNGKRWFPILCAVQADHSSGAGSHNAPRIEQMIQDGKLRISLQTPSIWLCRTIWTSDPALYSVLAEANIFARWVAGRARDTDALGNIPAQNFDRCDSTFSMDQRTILWITHLQPVREQHSIATKFSV